MEFVTFEYDANPKAPFDNVVCKIKLKIPVGYAVKDFLRYYETYLLKSDTIERCVLEDVPADYHIDYIDCISASREWPSGLKQRATCRLDICPGFRRLGKVDTYENLAKYIFESYDARVNYRSYEKWLYTCDPLDRHIGKIGRFIFDRESDNLNRNTFDFIRCNVSIMAVDDHYDFCKKNYKEIITRVLHKLGTDKRFIKYGVPITLLKVSKATILRDGDLALLFELKEV